ncbi:hypothetical protein EV175_001812, partial [Coemansia sp. RSA 1933]
MGGALRSQDDVELLCGLVTQGQTVEIRRNAAAALEQNELAVTEALLGGLLDQSVDNRGDVGSWVRKQCLETLIVLFGSDNTLLARIATEHGSDVVMVLLGRTLRATTEKLDKVRARAGELLEALLYGDDTAENPAVAIDLPSLLQESKTEEEEICSEGTNWADPEMAYAQVVHALSVSDQRIRQPLFEGLVVTGSTEPLGKFAVNAVSLYADTLPPPPNEVSSATKSSIGENGAADATASGQDDSRAEQWNVDGVINELTRLLLTDRRTSKVINPALIVADQLVEQGALASASPERQ